MHLDILVPIAGMATGLILLLPVVKAVVRVTEKKLAGGADSEELAALRDEVHFLRERVEGVEYAAERLAELEERVDFAERVLARRDDAPKIDGGA